MQNAKINLTKNGLTTDKHNQNVQRASMFKLTKTQKVELWEILTREYQQIVSMGDYIIEIG